MFYNKNRPEEIDEFILEFAQRYDKLFLNHKISMDKWNKIEAPRRLKAVTFWENQIFDPVMMIKKALDDNLEGLELSFDFHPFNYTKLLPEELTSEKRKEIRQACKKSGIKIDIHSPIVGPYAPSPDPKIGKQLFYNPVWCYEVISETIELAKDIGAGSVVIHLIDDSGLRTIADLVMGAKGSDVRVTIENYCQTSKRQNADFFIAAAEKVSRMLPEEVKERNFGITLDVGHFNIEGEDPLIASEKIGRWSQSTNTYLRVHSTDNYGKLLFNPPAYSADVHGNVSGRGINNEAVIKLLRSMGHQFDVVAEQIRPLATEDINAIHDAQSLPIEESYETLVSKGIKEISKTGVDALITSEVAGENAYQFLAGIEGLANLREHLVYRKIQDKKYLSVDEVRKISQDFMKMPLQYKKNIIEYIDDLLLPIQSEDGVIQKNELDLICQNISGALFATINSEHLNQIFSESRVYGKDDVVCKQGTAGQEMYLIKEGEVDVFINGFHLAVLGSGEIFGEISLFYNVKRTATIKAKQENTILGILTRESFETLLKRSEHYTYDLIYRLYNILPERLRNLNDKYKTAIDALTIIMDSDKESLSLNFLREGKPEEGLFPGLNQEESRYVFKDLKSYDEDQLIFAEGDDADGAYYIMEGSVKAFTFSSDYKEIELGELRKGEVFGEMALIDDQKRSASILTITPCKMGFIDKKAFNEFIKSRSALAFRLMGFICLSLFWRILRLDKIYADIKRAFH
jgi:CRP-like cAMP-binding protein/sugar phosphate isomerase/epimerase